MSLSSVGLCALLLALQVDAQGPAASPVDQEERVPVPVAAPTPKPVPTPLPLHLPPDTSLDALWSEYVRSETAGNPGEAGQRLHEIRRLRVQRNIDNLETIGLGLVARGVARLDADERDQAEASFGRAIQLAPGLPDGHYGLAVLQLKKGPLGVVPSVRTMQIGRAHV